MAVRYTICMYYPDLHQADMAYPFAVLAASPKDIALVGVNVTDTHPFQGKHSQDAVFAQQTFEIMVRRIETALRNSGNQSCLDALDRIVEDGRSNIQYRPLKDADADDANKVAELVFQGIREQWSAGARSEQKPEILHFPQVVLRLDDQDREAVTSGMPAYAVYGLRSAAQLVQSATVIYRGLRREGALRDGFAFSGRIPEAFDNGGNIIDAPHGKVFVVYADADGFVFDWDWVREDPHQPAYPVDAELRFTGDAEKVVPRTVLAGVENLVPGQFDWRKAWPSVRGDCIFCYFSDEFAYADRVNDDLTVFRSVATEEPTGFKIKNVARILKDGGAQMSAPDLGVAVQTYLLATLCRHPETIQVYSLLIGAWIRCTAKVEPPKIVPPRRELAAVMA